MGSFKEAANTTSKEAVPAEHGCADKGNPADRLPAAEWGDILWRQLQV